MISRLIALALLWAVCGGASALTPYQQVAAPRPLVFGCDLTQGSLCGATLTSGSQGSFTNSSGYLTSQTANSPRFNYQYNFATYPAQGLLYEGASATNKFTQTGTLNNAAWSNTNLTCTQTGTSPDGTSDAWSCNTGSATGVHWFGMGSGQTANVSHTCSVYAKAGTGRYFQINLGNQTTAKYQNFDAQTGRWGTQSVNSGSTPVGNGWYRFWITNTPTSVASPFCIFYQVTSLAAASGQ